MKVVDVRMHKVLHTYESEHYYSSSDNSMIGVSPQGRYVALGSKNGKVVVLDLQNGGECDNVFDKQHTSAVISVDWSRRSSKLASIDSRGSLIIWS